MKKDIKKLLAEDKRDKRMWAVFLIFLAIFTLYKTLRS